ncbi:MAG: PEP-CTERM-box response regulator transcription factor [Hahellaceae bacterium]|jgi:two-component system NtrC family response regulator|nr:PEP-CTERM-box response regulator transcription factor [Hahellaceae bacterium]
MNKKILIVEDDPGLQSQMRWCFENTEVFVADDRESALSQLRRHEPQVVTLDLGLPPDPGGATEGFFLLQEILALAPLTKVIVVTGRDERENAVKAIGMGACDYYQKPLDAEILNFVVQRGFRLYELEKENRELTQNSANNRLKGIIASSPKMLELCRMVEKIAPADLTTLILGETGTGKEVLARAIHDLSPRANRSFSAINCAAIPENLLESELFGHEKGAFTGASQLKKGKVELADGGTLFLDEIGDMPLPLQAKMLRFLQERVIERVGGVKEIPVNVRVLCATHRDVQALIRDGSFREDLYYRISELTLNVPPLRERREDAVMIARSLINTFCHSMDKPGLILSDDAVKAVQTYEWPGNVRELINKVKRAVIMCDGKRISARDLDLEAQDTITLHDVLNLRQVREDAEKQAILNALQNTQFNMAKTSRLLGITRPTLYNLTDKYGIDTSSSSNKDEE